MSNEIVTILVGLISALSTYFISRSKDKTTLIDTNLNHTTKLFEQYQNTVNQLSEKVDDLEEKLDLAEEEYRVEVRTKIDEINRLGEEIVSLNRRIVTLVDERDDLLNTLVKERESLKQEIGDE